MTKFLNNADIKGYIAQTAVTSYLLKADSTGRLVAAIAGTDYQAPTTALLPSGGTAGQILAKIDGTNYNTQWIDNYTPQVKHDVKLGAALSKGTPVYVSSANGTNMIVSAASNASEATSSKTLGLLETGGVLNDTVKVVTEGLLAGLDTSTATAGDPVWLGPSGTLLYGLANKPVAPVHMVFIGIVTRVQSVNGEIFIKVQNGFELDELHNVALSSVADGQGLFYESATSLWKNKTIASVLGYTPANGANYLPLSGGTLTGDLTLSGTNPRLYFTDTDNNPDYFISNTDGTFTVYDVTNSVGRFKIYTTGNAEFNNNLTAASFIKSGGTSAQFLKADGSVDSSTYLTSITSSQVTTALGYTPYNSTNPSGYITSSALSSYLPLSGGTLTGALSGTSATFSSTNGYLNLDAINSGANEAGLFLKMGGTNVWEIYTAANDDALNFWRAGGGIKFKIATSGAATFNSSVQATQIGINTSLTTSHKLQIQGGADSGMIITNSSGATRILLSPSGAQHGEFALYNNSGNATTYLGANGGNNYLQAQGGNIGIGTTSPVGKLSTYGGEIGTQITFTKDAPSGAYGRLGQDSNGTFLTQNAKWDGTSWTRDNTGGVPMALALHNGNGRYEFRIAANGTNPISWTNALVIESNAAATFSSSVTATNITLGSGTIGSIPSWMKVITTDATQSGIGSVFNNKVIYLYNNGSVFKLDAYDYATSTALNIQIGGNGGKVIVSNGQLQLNAYTTSTSFSGTAAGYLAFDSSGNVITVASVAATDSTKLPLAGGTMTGILYIARNLGTNDYTNVGQHNMHIQLKRAADGKKLELGVLDNGTGIIQANESGVGYYTLALNPVSGTVTINSYTALHAGNYNSYSPTLTGGGASGTWGINVTGSSRSLLFSGDSAKAFLDGLWAGGGSYPGYQFTGGNSRFGFSSTGGVVDVYTDGNFYATDSSYLVLHTGNIGSQSVTYATNSTRLYASDSPYTYTGTNPYYLYMNYDGGSYWELKVSPATPGAVRVAYANSAGSATTAATATNSTQLNGWGYTSYAYRVSGTGYYQIDTWMQMNGNFGLYWPSYYGLHLYPNNDGSYGSLQVKGLKNSWHGIYFDSGNTLMMNGNESGHYVQGYGWQFRWYAGQLYVSRGTYGGGSEYIAVDSGNVGSYALPLNGNWVGNTGMNDQRLYLRTNGDTNHYLWNAADDWEELVAYSGTGFRITASNGTVLATFSTSGNSMNITGSAGSAAYIPTRYDGIVSSNPQQYFGQSIGVKVAMTGAWSVWSDTLWINGYSGGDVLQMCALHTLRNGQPRMAISVQASNSTSYGTFYEFITSYNIASQTVANTTSISSAVGGAYSWTGVQYFKSNLGGYCGSLSNPPLQANSDSNNSAFLSFHKGGYYAVNMGLDADNVLRIGGWSASANRWQLDMSGNQTVAGNMSAGGTAYAYGYRGNANVGGTGEASWHPAGIYSGGTEWLYGTMYRNGSDTYHGWGNLYDVGAVYANNWFRAYGDCGLYTQDYGGHLRRNTESYGTWESFGYNKNGWGGFVVSNNYVTSQMHNSSGDFGFLTTNGSWWNLFYNRGNNCWGIGTDNTYSGDGFRCIKYGSAEYGWTTWSDRRAKENISNITGALNTVLAMRGVYFNYIKDEAKNKRVGFIAQELEQVLPEAVRYAEEIDEYSVEYAQIVSVLAEAIKEQNVKIQELETQLQTLLN